MLVSHRNISLYGGIEVDLQGKESFWKLGTLVATKIIWHHEAQMLFSKEEVVSTATCSSCWWQSTWALTSYAFFSEQQQCHENVHSEPCSLKWKLMLRIPSSETCGMDTCTTGVGKERHADNIGPQMMDGSSSWLLPSWLHSLWVCEWLLWETEYFNMEGDKPMVNKLPWWSGFCLSSPA